MSEFFPHEIKYELNGPLEALAYIGGAIVGAYIGWKAGAEAVEYATQIAQNPDVIGMLVKEHPLITKFVTLGIGAKVVGGISRFGGTLVDRVVGTYHESN